MRWYKAQRSNMSSESTKLLEAELARRDVRRVNFHSDDGDGGHKPTGASRLEGGARPSGVQDGRTRTGVTGEPTSPGSPLSPGSDDTARGPKRALRRSKSGSKSWKFDKNRSVRARARALLAADPND